MVQHVRRILRGSRHRSQPGGDAGFALIVVIGSGFVMILAMSLLAGYALNSMKGARREQDYYSAIEAARAGVDDAIARINAGAAAATTTDWTPWTPIPNTKDATGNPCTGTPLAVTCPQFRYRVDPDTASTRPNAVVIRSIGRSRNVERAVKVAAQPRSFLDYLYYSDVETIDPDDPLVYNGITAETNAYARTHCSDRAWASPRPSGCVEPIFHAGDKLSGARVHSNDVPQMVGSPVFKAPVSTAYPLCAATEPAATRACFRIPGGQSAAPTLDSPISYDANFSLPTTTTDLKTAAGVTHSGRKGCVYTGPTRIKLLNNGKMTVWSPLTPADPAATPADQRCGGGKDAIDGFLGGIVSGLLGGVLDLDDLLNSLPAAISAGTEVQVPRENVVYVQSATTPPTSPLFCAFKGVLGLTGTLDVNLTEGCQSGTLLVDGVLNGRVTMAAEDNILIMDDLTYKNGLTGLDDMLGLVARKSVEVYSPVQCTLAITTGCLSSQDALAFLAGNQTLTVQAAIMAMNGRFGVQLANVVPTTGVAGSPTLTVNGSLAQRFAGFVGGNLSTAALDLVNPSLPVNVGYRKNYAYDARLRASVPPEFPAPSQVSYDRGAFAEITVPTVP